MILVDSSIWVDHLRQANDQLATLLDEDQILGHPFMIGEIAVGSIKDRKGVLTRLHRLPQAEMALDEEVLQFILRYSLFGLGIGYIDMHLLVSVTKTPDARLWTRDKRLLAACVRMGVAYESVS